MCKLKTVYRTKTVTDWSRTHPADLSIRSHVLHILKCILFDGFKTKMQFCLFVSWFWASLRVCFVYGWLHAVRWASSLFCRILRVTNYKRSHLTKFILQPAEWREAPRGRCSANRPAMSAIKTDFLIFIGRCLTSTRCECREALRAVILTSRWSYRNKWWGAKWPRQKYYPPDYKSLYIMLLK